MKSLLRFLSVLPLAGFVFLGLAGCGERSSDAADQLRIAVIPKGTTHVFWKSVHAGALAAARDWSDRGVATEVIWKGPMREDDRALQVSVVETFIGQHVDGIVLAPLDSKALVAPVQVAREAGIPTVIIDSALDDQSIVSFAATDNFRGGEIAGHHLADKLGGKGRVVLLRYQVGSASTEAREAGFLKALESYPEIEIVSSNQYGGATRDTAFTASQNLLNRFAGRIDGVFACNESTTNGMLLALREFGLAGKVVLVGFDGGEQNVAALEAGDIEALVLQDPFGMGYAGVDAMVRHLRGEAVDARIDTGVKRVTRADLADPAVQALLNPPLDAVH